MPEIITRKEAKAAGLSRYYTGVPCRHGHLAERRTSDALCVECERHKARRVHQARFQRELAARQSHQSKGATT